MLRIRAVRLLAYGIGHLVGSPQTAVTDFMRDYMDTPVDFDAAQHFRNHPDPMWFYDPATLGFLAVNAAAIAQYGYSQDEFLTMTICDIYPAEDVDPYYAPYISVLIDAHRLFLKCADCVGSCPPH